jgi:hypothetical protein
MGIGLMGIAEPILSEAEGLHPSYEASYGMCTSLTVPGIAVSMLSFTAARAF